MLGFIKLHRKICKWEWYQDANTFRLFIHLLLQANHEDQRWQGHLITRGQVAVGRKSLAKSLKLSQQKIRTSLLKLKNSSEITIQSTNKYSLITVINYGSYQSKEIKATSTITNEQPTTNQQVTTNKNDKNDKNVKEDKDTGVKTSSKSSPCPYQQIINLYHEKLPMCPKVITITDARKRALSARWKNGAGDLKFWADYFISVSTSLWMTGQKDPPPGRKQFIADIDFLIKEKTIVGTQEGKYHE